MEADWLNLPDATYMARVAWRLGLAAILGGLIGVEREVQGKAAGLRTHTMVSLAAAAFVLVGLETNEDGLGAVIQGIATGVGFLGAGTILKKKEEDGIFGLTTAATIWLTAAVGVATGAGHGFLALFCVVVAWVVLTILARLDRRLNSTEDHGTGN